MNQNFGASLSLVLKSEGGFVNNPADPGGATNFGVTQPTYSAYRAARNLAYASVRGISPSEVMDIYRAQYWNAVHADDLPSGIDYCVFDEAVNSGVNKAIRDLQTALGVTVDGVIGGQTLAAAQSSNKSALIARICAIRLGFLHRLVTWATFGRGWGNRITAVQAAATKMALS